MLPHVALSLAYLFLFSAIVWKSSWYRMQGISQRWTLLAFWLKIAAGIVLWLVYTYHYTYRDTSDSYRFFDDAMIIRNLLHDQPMLFLRFMTGIGLDHPDVQPVMDQLHGWTSMHNYGLTFDSPTIVRINVGISFFSFGYYHVHTVFMCMLSFSGLVGIFKSFAPYFTHREGWVFIACFLLPTVVFWSSGVLKEAPLIAALGLFIYNGMKLYANGWNNRSVLFVLLAVFFLVYLKIYVIISMIPSILFLLWSKKTGNKFLIPSFVAIHIVCFLVAQNAEYFFSGGDFLHILERKQTDFYNVARDFDAKSTLHIPAITNSVSYFMHYPEALFLALFRPHLGEVKSTFYLLFALENLGYMLLLVMTFLRFKLPGKENRAIVLALLSFVLILGGIIGSTVPVLGAVVRYRIVILPFYVLLLAFCIKPMPFSWLKRGSPQGD